MRTGILGLSLLALVLSGAPSEAAIHFVDLGTGAPPASLGGLPVTPYDLAAQAAIPEFTQVTSIPGDPNPPATLTTVSPSVNKRNIGSGWATWSNGYTGAVYFRTGDSVTVSFQIPALAFYLYVEPNNFSPPFNITVTASDGTIAGPVLVSGTGGARGFGFYSDVVNAGIANVRVDADPAANGFAVGELGIGRSVPIPTLSEWAMILLVALLVIIGVRQIQIGRPQQFA